MTHFPTLISSATAFTLFASVLSACAATPSTPAQATPLPDHTPVHASQSKQTASDPVPVPSLKPKNLRQERVQQTTRFNAWKRDFITRAIAKGYVPDLVQSTIGSAKINPEAIQSNKTQPEFSRPIWTYVDGVLSESRLTKGRAKLAEHAKLFNSIEETYGVDRYILTSIWGLETAYGNIMGHDNMIDSLATLAFEGRRAQFGEQQLFGLLDMLSRGDVRKEQLIGSWAGAMGMTQFIPTTFRDYAVDYDNNGNKDLWTNAGDALASGASYLSRFGWRATEPVYTEIILPKGFDYGLSDGTKRTLSGWSALGVRAVGGQAWSNQALFLEAKLLLPAGKNGPALLTFKNFDVIKKYNNSTAYALGIAVLARGFQNQTGIVRDWPRGDKQLSLTDKKNLQQALTRQGYSTGGVDGMIGPNSRRAIRAWQRANKVPADGYVNQALLAKILEGVDN